MASGWQKRFHRRRYQLFLVGLLLLVLFEPLSRGSTWGTVTLDIFFCTVLLAAAATALDETRRFTVAVVATLAVVLTWSDTLTLPDERSWRVGVLLLQNAVYLTFLTAITWILLRDVLRARRVTFDTICGSICVYLALGLCWSIMYSIGECVQADSFGSPDTAPRDFSSFLYFSYVTLTTLGYGDITPKGGLVQTWAWLEAVAGQFYISILVAKLVSAYVARELATSMSAQEERARSEEDQPADAIH